MIMGIFTGVMYSGVQNYNQYFSERHGYLTQYFMQKSSMPKNNGLEVTHFLDINRGYIGSIKDANGNLMYQHVHDNFAVDPNR
jgi:hypothetical protein